jgi:hypothetical protein
LSALEASALGASALGAGFDSAFAFGVGAAAFEEANSVVYFLPLWVKVSSPAVLALRNDSLKEMSLTESELIPFSP